MSTADGTQGAIGYFVERDEHFFPLNGTISHLSGKERRSDEELTFGKWM